MNKLLLASLISLSSLTAAEQTAAAPLPANGIEALMDGPHLCLRHLGKNDRNKALITTAIFSIYPAMFLVMAYTDPFISTRARIITSSILCALPVIGGPALTYVNIAPHFHWSQKERDMLTIVLENQTEQELLDALDFYFATNSLSRSQAFNKLSNISKRLTRAKEIFVHTKNVRYQELIAVLTDNIAALNKALMAIKRQPNWDTQSSTTAISYSEKVQDNGTQAQLLIR